MGVQGIDTQTQLSIYLLISCRMRLRCVGKVYTRAQAEPGPTRLLPNHLGLPQSNELGQCTPTGRYRPSSHQEDCCLPHGTHSTNDRRQTPTVPSPTSCLKPTNLDNVHLLAGIAPPHIRRTVACRMERTRQTTDARHRLFHHQPAASRLKSRKSFMCTVTPLDSSASSSRMLLWKDSLTDVPASVKMGLEMTESLPSESGEDWLCWRALNRLRTGVGRAKTVMRRWGYLDDAQSVDCDCGEPKTMAHLLSLVQALYDFSRNKLQQKVSQRLLVNRGVLYDILKV